MMLDPDTQPGPEEESYWAWGDTLNAWRSSPPVMVFATDADGAPIAKDMMDTDTNPLVWRGVEVNPFDRSTFEQVELSEVGGVTTLEQPRFYPTVLAWYRAEIDPSMGGPG